VHFDRRLLMKIVTVHGNIHRSARDRFVPNFADSIGQATCEVNSAPLDADDDDFLVGFVAFSDLGGHALNGALDDSGG
jgi:hypothetical protein